MSHYRENGIKTYSAKEALKREAEDLVVAEGQTVTLTPSSRELAHHFARVQLTAFEDLQALGFVPRRIAEQDLRRAIGSDDDEAYKMTVSLLASSAMSSPCGCNDRPATTRPESRYPSFQSRLQTTYKEVRKSNNPALARLLSDHYQARIPFDDPTPTLVKNWISYFDVTARFGEPILISVLQDVTIHRRGVLTTDPKVKSFLARYISIHRTGQLVQRGSYMKIWATEISSFIGLQDIVIASTDAPWRL